MGRKPYRDEVKHFQVTWEDLEPWAQQLYEDHGVGLRFEVFILGRETGTRSAVVMNATRNRVGAKVEEVKRDWKVFSLNAVGAVEHYALQMASLLLLELENDKAAAEARQGRLWA